MHNLSFAIQSSVQKDQYPPVLIYAVLLLYAAASLLIGFQVGSDVSEVSLLLSMHADAFTLGICIFYAM